MIDLIYYGHACFGVKIGNHHLLFDPFIRNNPLAGHIDPATIHADFILISHAHRDHLEDAFEIASRNQSVIISNLEVNRWMRQQDIKGGHGLNHGGKLNLEFGSVKFVKAIHSSQFADGTYGGNPGGFIIESAEGNFYFAGDTALTMEMKLIPLFCKLDFAMLPIGGYFTMDFHDAAIAAAFIECNKIIGMHFDSFPQIKINHEDAVNTFKEKGKELVLLKVGDSVSL
jgi:L-ascorbate metabolism protein UlaG (beta-lactamase superfamily)